MTEDASSRAAAPPSPGSHVNNQNIQKTTKQQNKMKTRWNVRMCAVGKRASRAAQALGKHVKYWWSMRRQALQEGLGSPASKRALLAVGQPPLWCWLGRTCSPSCRWGGRLATLSQETAQCVRVGGWPARQHVPWSTLTATQAPPCRSPRRPTPSLPEHVASVGLVAGDTRGPSRESGGHGGGLRPWRACRSRKQAMA